MRLQKFRVEEMQPICFWYKRGYSGTDFGLHLLNHNRYIMMKQGGGIFYKSYVMRRPYFQTNLPQWLKGLAIGRFTLPYLLRAHFIYKYHRDKPHMNPRIVPIILWEPHINTVDIHDSLILNFLYRTVLNSVRNPNYNDRTYLLA